MGLTPRQQRFVDEYVASLNAADAARKAGYSEKNADKLGSRLLDHPDVVAAVEAKRKVAAERAEVTAEQVRRELAAIAFSDVRDFVAWGGTTVMLKASPDLESASAVQSVAGDGKRVSIRMHDKIQALRLLGLDFGMFKERLEVDLGLAELFETVRNKARAGATE